MRRISTSDKVFLGPNGEPLSLDDIWTRADDQKKIFEKVPMDSRDYYFNLSITPSENLEICTPRGHRRVKVVELPMRLRWKYEEVPLSDAKISRYRAGDSTDSFPEQVVVEFQTSQASKQNLQIGFQFPKVRGQCTFPPRSSLLSLAIHRAPKTSPRRTDNRSIALRSVELQRGSIRLPVVAVNENGVLFVKRA